MKCIVGHEGCAHGRGPIVALGRIPDITAINVTIRCIRCEHVIQGHAMWSIRKSAQLHNIGPCGGTRFELDDTLAALEMAQ